MAEKLRPHGWEFMSLDCGYSTKRRDDGGNLVVNTTRFPHGMAWLGEQLHNLGLKYGMYAGQGLSQCCSKIDPHATDGSAGWYEKDAELFASWKIDYLKFDGCAGPKSSIAAMKKALNATGRPVVYSINNGVQANNSEETNLWRTTPDTSNTFPSMIWTAMVNNNATQIVAGKPGAFLDADMLEVGNFFSELADAEGRTNFALWCLMKAPLLLGTDMTNMTDATLKTITSPGAISVSKDALGEQGLLRESPCYNPAGPNFGPDGHTLLDQWDDGYTAPVYGTPCGHQVWSGALSNGGAAVVLANLDDNAAATIDLSAKLLPTSQAATPRWDINNAYSGKTVCRGCKLPQSAKVAPHDVAFWVLTPAE